jgi:hypothetical protein
MSTWKLSTAEKKSCTQIEFYKKGDLVAQHEIGWRWCWARYKEKPDLSDYDSEKDQVELYSLGDVEDMEQDDGCWDSWTWPDDIDEEEQERLEEIYNEEGDDGFENEGWVPEETEYWVSGPLDIEKEISWYIDGNEPMVLVERWTKDDLVVEQRKTLETTHVVFDEEPDISGYDPTDQFDLKSLNIATAYETEKISEEWEFPEEMSKKEQNWFKKYDWDKWTKAGWTHQNKQLWITGEIELTKDEEE